MRYPINQLDVLTFITGGMQEADERMSDEQAKLLAATVWFFIKDWNEANAAGIALGVTDPLTLENFRERVFPRPAE